jgi:hypothetical protein
MVDLLKMCGGWSIVTPFGVCNFFPFPGIGVFRQGFLTGWTVSGKIDQILVISNLAMGAGPVCRVVPRKFCPFQSFHGIRAKMLRYFNGALHTKTPIGVFGFGHGF